MSADVITVALAALVVILLLAPRRRASHWRSHDLDPVEPPAAPPK